MQQCFFAFMIPVVGLLACKQIKTDQPPPCESQYVVVPQDTSFLSTSLIIPTQLIEDKLNNAIGQEILNDDDFDSSKKSKESDNLKLKITRLGDIQVSWKDNVARYQAPLLVLIERQIVGKNVLPRSKSLALKTEFSLRLVFETSVDIGEDWKLQPHTKFVLFEWLSEVKTLGGLVDLKKMIERRIHRQMPEILVNMDATIRAAVRLDRSIEKVWQNIQKPMVINKREELVWLKINPIQFEMGAIASEGGNLLIQSRLSATTETLVGDNPAYTIDSILPPLLKRRVLPDTAYFYMLSEIPYKNINETLASKLRGEMFEISGRRITVADVDVRGCGPNLVLHLKVFGAAQGDIYFQGIPRYEPDSQYIVIQNFDFEVETQEALLRSADWLLHSTFKEQMKAALSIPLAEQIVKIPEAITRGIERGKAGRKMDFSIEHWDFKPRQIWVRPTDIAALVIVNARVRVELEKF
jgi:Domain of unknown function (DUF4403)